MIEDQRGRCIYVSETQDGYHRVLQFNEFPPLPYAATRIQLIIAAKLPGSLLESGEGSWVRLRSFSIDFRKLHWINDSDIVDREVIGVNVPVFEFFDGYFAIEGMVQPSSPPNIESTIQKKTFTFNSLLKLNKILEYLAQVKAETGSELSVEIESLLEPKTPDNTKVIKQSIQQVECTILQRRKNIELLRKQLGTICVRHDPTESLLNDEYGSVYSDFTQKKQNFHSIQSHKLEQLIKIFENTGIFEEGCVLLNEAHESVYYLNLTTLDAEKMVGRDKRENVNTLLGYYLLFVQLLAKNVFFLPLPYALSFYGSTSVIKNQFPLYLTASPTQQHLANFVTAISYFNADILQIKQYLEHHR